MSAVSYIFSAILFFSLLTYLLIKHASDQRKTQKAENLKKLKPSPDNWRNVEYCRENSLILGDADRKMFFLFFLTVESTKTGINFWLLILALIVIFLFVIAFILLFSKKNIKRNKIKESDPGQDYNMGGEHMCYPICTPKGSLQTQFNSITDTVDGADDPDTEDLKIYPGNA